MQTQPVTVFSIVKGEKHRGRVLSDSWSVKPWVSLRWSSIIRPVQYYETFLKCQTKKGLCLFEPFFERGELDPSALSVIKYASILQEFMVVQLGVKIIGL